MSEENKSRSVADIQNEYSSACARAGHIQYQIEILGKDLSKLNELLFNLNAEAMELKAAESKAAAEEKKE